MANADLINFYKNVSDKATLPKLIRETQNKSIYETLRLWIGYGYVRRRIKPDRRGNNPFRSESRGAPRRIYELTPKGKRYIEFKSKSRR